MQSQWSRMIIDDASKVGHKIVEWTLKPETRPSKGDFEAFKEQLEGGLRIVDPKATKFELVDTPSDTIVIRLPPADLIRQAKAQYSAPAAKLEEYPFPGFLGDAIDLQKLTTPGVTVEELFYSFVGSYTTAECE